MAFLPLFTICFCLGICLIRWIPVPFLFLYTLAWILLILSFVFILTPIGLKTYRLKQLLRGCIKHTNFVWPLFILAILLGGLFLSNACILPYPHIRNFTFYKSEFVVIRGVVVSLPQEKTNFSSFIINARQLTWAGRIYPVCGKVLVRVFRKNEFSYGDRLLLKGKLYRPFSSAESEFNYREYLKRKGIYSILSIKKDNPVKRLGTNAGNPLKSLALRIRHKMKGVISRDLSSFSAGILNAIILGQRQDLPVSVRDVLAKSGSVHLIAISGLHLAIVVFITMVILKIIRIPQRPRYILTILLLFVYCILTGARMPVVRAAVMASILLFGYFLERELSIYNSLSFAALVILVVNPRQLFGISFQLSFLSVISIVWLAPKIKSIFPGRLYRVFWARFLILSFSVSAGAWLGLLPVIAYYFRIITPVAVPANMIIIPYMSIIVASGFTLALIGMFLPCLIPLFASSCELFILILFKINSLLITIPGAYFELPRVAFGYVLFYYALLILIFRRQAPDFKSKALLN